MKAIKAVLYIYAALFIIAGVFTILPWEWVNAVMAWFGPIAYPDDKIVPYTVRNFFLVIFWLGVLLAVAVRDPVPHRTVLLVLGGTFLSVAVLCLLLGMRYGLPPFFYWDFASSAVLGGLLLAYRGKTGAPAG